MAIARFTAPPLAALLLLASPCAAQCAWHSQGFLTPAGGYGSEPQYFARSLSLRGSELLVGSPGLDGATGVGQLFAHTPDGWMHTDTLAAAALTPTDDFGRAVALDGDVAVVGAPLAGNLDGRVIVFERVAGIWTEVASLTAAPGQAGRLGSAVALRGNTLLAGAPEIDAVVVFARSDAGWAQTAVLTPTESAESFGSTLAFDGLHAVIGAPDDEEAFVFEVTPLGLVESARLEAEDELVEARFGSSVAIAGDIVAIGAEGEEEEDELSGGGAVYVFRHSGDWVQEAAIPAPSGLAGVRFGASVALDADVLAVGSPGDQGGLGRVFAFLGVAGYWFEAAQLDPYLEGAQGQFGTAVALEEAKLLANVGLDETGLIGAVGPYAGAAQAWIAPALGCLPLLADVRTISIAAGGTQALWLDPGSEQIAPFYLVLGSAAGTSPGMVVGAVTVPLNQDAYLAWTLTSANTGPLGATFGPFAAGGATIATLSLPSHSSSALVGLALHHAFVALDPAAPELITSASNAVGVDLVP